MGTAGTGVTAAATDEQRGVAAMPPDARTLVQAGPGTGKTHTLLLRATALADEHGLALPGEVLVLSFTNAVVEELRRRSRDFRALGGALLAETFDAFARRLLRECSDEPGWEDLDFDGKVRAATILISGGAADEVLSDVGHILLDEVQDLVDVRAEMVLAAIARHGGGFTAFGDPAQAIYDWGHDPATDPVPFDERLRAAVPELRCAELTVDHRTRSELARVAHRQGAFLRRRLPESDVAVRLRRIVSSLDSMGSPDEAASHLASTTQSTGVLCRDNATALLVARSLAQAGVDHAVRRSARDRPVPAWVAMVARANPRTQLRREQAESTLRELADAGLDVPEPVKAWSLLSRLGSSDDRVVSLERVARRLSSGARPLLLGVSESTPILISTVHRAKGLEYEVVVIADWPERPDETSDEARVLFVALTRARDDLWHMTAPTVYPWCLDRLIGRWVKGHPNPRYRGRTYGIELRPDDIDHRQPAGTSVHLEDPVVIQHRLSHEVGPRDAVDLRLLLVRSGEPAEPVYGVFHHSGFLGITGPSLGAALARRIFGERFPVAIRQVALDGVESVVGLPEEARAADLGSAGLWLRPRLVGLGELIWSDVEEP